MRMIRKDSTRYEECKEPKITSGSPKMPRSTNIGLQNLKLPNRVSQKLLTRSRQEMMINNADIFVPKMPCNGCKPPGIGEVVVNGGEAAAGRKSAPSRQPTLLSLRIYGVANDDSDHQSTSPYVHELDLTAEKIIQLMVCPKML